MNTTNITEYIMLGIKKFLAYLGIPMHLLDKVEPFLYIIVIAGIAFLLAEIVYRIVLLLSKRILKHKEYTFIAKLLEYNALRKQAYILPPIIMNTLLPLAFGHNPTLLHYMENAVWIYFVVAVTMAVTAIITSIGETAFRNRKYHDRPIKGFIQVAKITVYIITTILIISIVTDKSPVYLIGGLGAFAAVLMLITKDSIMGFVGGFLLLENDMVRLGDWIEIPDSAINGTVIDISLTIVKVRNFDNTIATIPPYTLINNSFLNWRGMSESGGRRIARGYTIKLDTIRPCNSEFLEKLKGMDPEFDKYISLKQEQSDNNEIRNTNNATGIANGTIETNAGLFRAYADMYLRHHPLIRKDMLIMVRTLTPTSNGLPIQFYCFTSITEWAQYESIQAEIMEHFASIMSLFELYPYQSTSARDTIISGLLEASYPIEKIKGMPYRTTK